MGKAIIQIGFPVTFNTSSSSGSVTFGYLENDISSGAATFNYSTLNFGYQAADLLYTWLQDYSENYTITKSGTGVTVEAKNNGSQWNFDTSSFSSSDGSTIQITQSDYSAPCDIAFLTPKTTIENDIGSQGVGSITIHATSSYPLLYAIQRQGGVKTSYQSSPIFENLISGNYTAFILDTNGCSDSVNFQEVGNDACVLQVDVKDITHETGTDLNDGSVKAVPKNSAYGTIYYSLDGGPEQTLVLFTGIAPGLHTVFIRDSSGCTSFKNFTINAYVEPPSEPETIPCFDPLMVISDALPYRFILKKCSAADETETLYNETDYCQGERPCYFQKIKCNDTLTLQFYYLDSVNNSIPILKIKDFDTKGVVATLPFTDLGSGYYKMERSMSTMPSLCEKIVYLEIKSTVSDEELFVHAESEPIKVSNYLDCNLLLEYWNDSDYRDILYEDTDYVNKMRLEATLEVDDYPQEIEVYVKSNGESVPLHEEIREENILEVNYSPMYIHKKIALALSHQHVRIEGIEYVKEEPYTFEKIRNFALRKGIGKLLTKTYQSKNLIK